MSQTETIKATRYSLRSVIQNSLVSLAAILVAGILMSQAGIETISSLKAAESQDEAAPAETSPDLRLGKIMFIQCRSCHSVEAGEDHLIGPNLNHILGSKAGSKEGFDYSSAMATSGIVWTEPLLNEFVKKPSALVPGTIMAFAGIEDDANRKALIAYLLNQTE